jgi:hypothetical protein
MLGGASQLREAVAILDFDGSSSAIVVRRLDQSSRMR